MHDFRTDVHNLLGSATQSDSTDPLGVCNGPGVVQRRDRQKKEFHDQSDYR